MEIEGGNKVFSHWSYCIFPSIEFKIFLINVLSVNFFYTSTYNMLPSMQCTNILKYYTVTEIGASNSKMEK